jgi:hypothetical protein
MKKFSLSTKIQEFRGSCKIALFSFWIKSPLFKHEGSEEHEENLPQSHENTEEAQRSFRLLL